MAITYQEHVLVRWGGTIGEDTWSCGVRMGASPGFDDAGWAASIMDDLAALLTGLAGDSNAGWNPLAKLVWVRANAIGTNGKYTQASTNYLELNPVVTPAGTYIAPPQLAICVTLTTDVERGRAHSGRYYLPPNINTVDASGRIDHSKTQAMATRHAQFIADLGALGNNSHRVRIMSALDGTQNDVTGVKVGDVFDTQQRRRRQIAEVYSSAPVP